MPFIAPEIDKLLDKVRGLAKYFRSSALKSQLLINMQQRLNADQIKLKLDTDTRWNSVHDSIERLLKCRQAILNIGFEEIEVAQLNLSEEEWQDLIQLRNTLSSFKDITDIISSARNPFISMLKPLIFIILESVLVVCPQDRDICQTVKLLIREDFTQRICSYESVDDLLLLESVLDPRFKNTEYLRENEKKRTRRLLKEKFQEYKNYLHDSHEEAKHEQKQIKVKLTVLEKVFKFSNASSTTNNEFGEIMKYFQVESISIAEDPIEWWKENSISFKILSLVARDLIFIPATSTPSERIFSKAGHIVSKKRSSLSSKSLDSLIFLAENKNSK